MLNDLCLPASLSIQIWNIRKYFIFASVQKSLLIRCPILCCFEKNKITEPENDWWQCIRANKMSAFTEYHWTKRFYVSVKGNREMECKYSVLVCCNRYERGWFFPSQSYILLCSVSLSQPQNNTGKKYIVMDTLVDEKKDVW